MILSLLAISVLSSAEGFFLPPHLQSAAGPGAAQHLRGHAQGNGYWPEFNKVEENLNYNNRFLYQGPNFQQYSDSQRYFAQGAAQQAYGSPNQQLYQQQPEPLSEPVFSDIRESPLYIQPYDEETTRQQTLTVTPQYLRLPPRMHPNAIQQQPQQQFNQQPFNQQQVPNINGVQNTAQTTIPVLVKISDNQALIVPVRAVYALPGFLERLVQRVQGYYSVYNPIESLTVDRPYYVPTTLAPFQPLDTPAGASGIQSVNANLVQETGDASAEMSDSSSGLDTKFNEVKQEEIKDETTTVSDDQKETTTEDAGESSTNKDENPVEDNESGETTTNLPSSSSDDNASPTTASPPSSDSSPTTAAAQSESSPTTVAATSELPSTTEKPEEPAVEEGAQSSEDNSASSDLQSAGYTYYKPAIPFYYPPPPK